MGVRYYLRGKRGKPAGLPIIKIIISKECLTRLNLIQNGPEEISSPMTLTLSLGLILSSGSQVLVGIRSPGQLEQRPNVSLSRSVERPEKLHSYQVKSLVSSGLHIGNHLSTI